MKDSDMRRFQAATARDENGCLVWTRALFGDRGYGAFWLDGRTIGAHRVAYRIAHGEIPEGMLVRHKCDNRPCVEPSHLELGTTADNARDAAERGRKPNGIYHTQARLSDEEVAEIRALCARGERQRDVARIYGCTQAHVSLLVRGRLRKRPSTPQVTSPRSVTQ